MPYEITAPFDRNERTDNALLSQSVLGALFENKNLNAIGRPKTTDLPPEFPQADKILTACGGAADAGDAEKPYKVPDGKERPIVEADKLTPEQQKQLLASVEQVADLGRRIVEKLDKNEPLGDLTKQLKTALNAPDFQAHFSNVYDGMRCGTGANVYYPGEGTIISINERGLMINTKGEDGNARPIPFRYFQQTVEDLLRKGSNRPGSA
jgi:hypothetical protein